VLHPCRRLAGARHPGDDSPVSELSPGKVPWDVVARHLRGVTGEDVALGPAAGEDAALVRIGGELWAVASDPISFTAADAGRLAVIVNANDVAVMGATPRFFLAVLLVAPTEATEAKVGELLDQIRAACERLGVALIGGHSEVTPGLEHSLVVGTMLGRVARRPLRSGGLEVGDRIGMSKWAGLEGSAILIAEHCDRLRAIHGAEAFRELEDLLSEDWLSVVPEATLAAGIAGVHALHDVTEGGVGEALHELARASGVEIEAAAGDVPVLDATRIITGDLGLDPLGLIGSGALLVGCADESAGELAAAYAEHGIPFAWIGRVAGARPAGGGRSSLPRFPRDEILKTQLLADVEAVIFDMDGTLVDSAYDWRAIRDELGIDAPSLIDALNGLEGEEREAKWRRLAEIERRATAAATLQDGALEVLAFLRRAGDPGSPGDQQHGGEHRLAAGALRPDIRPGADPRRRPVEAFRGAGGRGHPAPRRAGGALPQGRRLALRRRRRPRRRLRPPGHPPRSDWRARSRPEVPGRRPPRRRAPGPAPRRRDRASRSIGVRDARASSGPGSPSPGRSRGPCRPCRCRRGSVSGSCRPRRRRRLQTALARAAPGRQRKQWPARRREEPGAVGSSRERICTPVQSSPSAEDLCTGV
jgi:hydrogenase expression/formation protein HypE